MFERVYETVWSKKLARDFESGRARIVSRLLPSITGDNLLDIGCGNGEMGPYFSNRFKEVHGVDISDNVLKAAAKKGVIAKKVDLNHEPLPYEDFLFDMITCLDVIEHVFDPNYLLSEVRRVLKNGGVFVLSYPNIGFIKFRLSIMTGSFPMTAGDPEPYDGGHIHYWTVRDMRKMLSRNSLTPFKIAATGKVQGIKQLWPNLLARNPFIISRKEIRQ